MSENKKVNSLTLDKKEALAKYLVAMNNGAEFKPSAPSSHNAEAFKSAKEALKSAEEIKLSDESVAKILLSVDKIVLGGNEIPQSRLTDQKSGHWDLCLSSDGDKKEQASFNWQEGFYQRNPNKDTVRSGIVAIDFGTKNTVAGFIDDNSNKQLIRIGTANIKRSEAKNDYENPTIMQFVDLQSFWDDYCSSKNRPLTNWNDLPISYNAQGGFENANDNDFYSFFAKLKQWAGKDKQEEKEAIKDLNKYERVMKPLVDYEDGEINPIEIYAYYIGRYINTMEKGIYLHYLLSYPVEYSKASKEKIRSSFERGLRRSLPSSIFEGEYAKEFKVELITTEPAAYALSALQAYGFDRDEYLEQNTYFGVFDFGGGTTDFDFGVWKASERDDRYVWDIRHFGGDGDVYLGGENLLEVLAYEIFKDNHESMMGKNCSYPYVRGCEKFGGSEILDENQISKRNMSSLIEEYLREFWEEYEEFDSDENENEKKQDLKKGLITPLIMDAQNNVADIKLKVSIDNLKKILKDRISLGVEKFFGAFENVFSGKKIKEDLKVLHIFLGGNSSRSPLVKEAFDSKIAEIKKEHPELNFAIYPPLGTPEAQEKMEELGLQEKTTNDISKVISCKTGVVFGLLDGRKTGEVRVINDIKPDAEAKFRYHLGISRQGKFKTRINRNKAEINESQYPFLSYADTSEFELYYTDDPRAPSDKLDIHTAGIKRLKCPLDRVYGEDDTIEIQILSINTIKYAVFSGDKKRFESEEIYLSR